MTDKQTDKQTKPQIFNQVIAELEQHQSEDHFLKDLNCDENLWNTYY